MQSFGGKQGVLWGMSKWRIVGKLRHQEGWIFWELSLLATGQQNSAEQSLVSSNGCRVQAAHPEPKIFKVQFRRRTFHEPNLIRIKVDPNYLDLPNWFRRRSNSTWTKFKRRKMLVLVKPLAKYALLIDLDAELFMYLIQCIRFG